MLIKNYKIWLAVILSIFLICFAIYADFLSYLRDYKNAVTDSNIDPAASAITKVSSEEINSPTWLGIEGLNVNEAIAAAMGLKKVAGVLIDKVIPSSPAANASDGGLLRGDIIIKFNRRIVTDLASLKSLIETTEAGDIIRIEIVREGEKSGYYVQMETRPGNAAIIQVASTDATKSKTQTSQIIQVAATSSADFFSWENWGVLTMLAQFILLFLHYFIFGPNYIHKKSKKYIRWFALDEQVMHILLAISFALLAIIGFTLCQVVSKGTNSYLKQLEPFVVIHVIIGAVFAFSLLWLLFKWFKHVFYFDDYDKEWVRHFGGYFYTRSNKMEFPVGRFNPGQKMFFWSVFISGMVLAITGIMIIRDNTFGSDYSNLAHLIHYIFAYILLNGVITHIYIALIANPGSLRSMLSGYVPEEWARAHHLLWYKRVKNDALEEI